MDARIRKSSATWQDDFQSAFGFIEKNLFLVNPTISAILRVWEEFKNTRLLDVDAILSKGSSYELRAFRSSTVQKFDKTVEKLLTR